MSQTEIPEPTACWRVFTTTELAEQILLELPARDLLTIIQRVCWQWRNIVDASTPIQQALFFKPIAGGALTFHRTGHHLNRRNPDGLFITKSNESVQIYPHEHPLVARMAYGNINEEVTTRLEASWRRMLITQPPMAQCHVEELNNEHSRTVVRTKHVMVEGSGGVVMQQVAESHDIFGKEWCWKDVEGWFYWKNFQWKVVSAREFLRRVRLAIRRAERV